jgi:hypothetical protein
MSFHLLALSLNVFKNKTIKDVKNIQRHVHQCYGYKSLAQSTNFSAPQAIYIFKSIVLSEHRIVQILLNNHPFYAKKNGLTNINNNWDSKYIKDVMRGLSVTKNPFIISCERLQELVDDLYNEGDGQFLDFKDKNNKNDNELIQHKQKITIIILDNLQRYAGHVYAWSDGLDSSVLHVMYIRGSVLNQSTNYLPNITEKLFYGIAQWAKIYNYKKIMVSCPMDHVLQILKNKLGFKKICLHKPNLIILTKELFLQTHELHKNVTTFSFKDYTN